MSSQLFNYSQCIVCFDFYKDPRILSCGHTFCAECLEKLIRPTLFINVNIFFASFNRDIIACPVCNKSIDVTSGRAASLPKNFVAADLVDSLHQCAFGHPDADSDRNNHDQALHYCVDCRLSLCESCCTEHSETDSSTAGHLIKTLDDVTNTDARSRQNFYRFSQTAAPPPDHVIPQRLNFVQIITRRFIEMCKRHFRRLPSLRGRRWNGSATLGVLCSIIIALLVATLISLVYQNPAVTAKECNCKQKPRTVHEPFDTKPPKHAYSAVTVAQLSHEITVKQMANSDWGVNILSVSDDGWLLASCTQCTHVFIRSPNSNAAFIEVTLSSVIDADAQLVDVSWTMLDSIVLTTTGKKSKIISIQLQLPAGELSKSCYAMVMPSPQMISLADNDGISYFADTEKGVYRSIDGGIEWKFVFNSSDKAAIRQVVQVSNREYWSMEELAQRYYLRAYLKLPVQNNYHRLTIDIPSSASLQLDERCKLAYNSRTDVVLLTDGESRIHVFNVTERKYRASLLSPIQLGNKAPRSLAVDVVRQVLYVGQGRGLIRGFTLKTYWEPA